MYPVHVILKKSPKGRKKEEKKTMKLNISYENLNDLKPYENNAKIHTDEQIQQIAESIKQFGMNDPIAVWKNGEIIEGHGRLEACRFLGIEEVPVIHLDDLTDEQRRAYMNVHNQLTMNTGFDLVLLTEELEKIKDIDMSLFGFDAFQDEEAEVYEDEYQEPEEIEPRTKRGDVYRLGDHTLMCGDSTSEEDVQKLVGGGLLDLCVTDPPYNVGLGMDKGHAIRPSEAKQLHRRTDGLTIANDSMQEDEFIKFLTSAFQNMKNSLKDGAVFYIWFASSSEMEFLTALEEAGLRNREMLIWVKNHFALGRQDYQWRHEPCLYGWKDGAGHYFTNSRSESTVIDDTPDLDRITKAEAVELLRRIYESEPTSVVHEAKPNVSILHPTMKPVALIGYQIANSSRKGETVLDLFGGSGTTMIACEQLGRKCFMMEYDPHYADVIIDRWEKFTGKKAELEVGNV